MVFFVKYNDGEESGWLFFERPDHLARRQYRPIDKQYIHILDHQGQWYGAFFFQEDGAGQRNLLHTEVLFGSGAQIWARMRTNFGSFATKYQVRPMRVIQDDTVIQTEDCASCQGKGYFETESYLDGQPCSKHDCGSCCGTKVQETAAFKRTDVL